LIFPVTERRKLVEIGVKAFMSAITAKDQKQETHKIMGVPLHFIY